ncbi:Gfo/Idh/MocA family oxidoreductase [Calothrix sp. UHCC 0171]|uniref:Gfo/Idh/MocA family protein n=1 Tax=Calothrix sp. UHCC 0171 TaxID=3110245 RepID=UPI002B217F96|nr:Gfo/Idh/MocA family oxidoreductase [Calothrix sp. UHCC 0171]MEA5570705.1 Gfo/Idh/MocA family oxidoreductase [Calothrix sp. UHCC 0171]
MTKKINLAVIGVGRWGVHWLRVVSENPQANLVAVVEPNPERLEVVKRQYRLSDDILLTTEWQALQKLPELDGVIIATPAVTHYSLIMDALHWGLHILAEKPLTIHPWECRELSQLAEQQQRILMVDHTYLFHPAVTRGKAIIESGELGNLRYGYATRTHLGPVRQDVDALWDLAIHDIAIFNTWLGEYPVKVQATGSVWLQEKQSDLVWATLTYPSGFQANIHLCWLNNDKQRRLGIVGSQGSLIFDEMLTNAPLTLLKGEFDIQDNCYIPVNHSQQILELEKAEPLQKACQYFLECIQKNTYPVISSAQVGTKLVEILTALSESLHQGGVTIFLD